MKALKQADEFALGMSYFKSTTNRIRIFKMFGEIYEELKTSQDAFDAYNTVVDLTTLVYD